jgi:flagellar biogenesis protein FliO
MEVAQFNVENGNEELTQAAEKQKGNNSCLFVILAVALLFVVLLIWLGF